MDLDLAPYQSALNLIHVLAVMAFILCHGFSGLVALRIRGERDRARIQTMVQVSDSFLNWGWLALAVVLFGGILAGISGGWWTSGRLWIWVSLVLFIVVGALMTPIAGAYMISVRRALGQPTRDDKRKGRPAPEPASDEELAAIVASNRPIWAATIGLAGIAVLTWLMVDKPF